MIRTDGAGTSWEFLAFLTTRGVAYSIGWTLPWAQMGEIYQAVTTAGGWTPALTAAGEVNEHADVADLLTQRGHLTGWPDGMRIIVRRERPHPGARVAQDRLDDAEGYRLTVFATDTRAVGSPRPSSYATANEPAVRTGSAAPRTPACATSPSRRSRTTKSGSTWSLSPVISWSGSASSASRTGPVGRGSRNGYGCACSPPQP